MPSVTQLVLTGMPTGLGNKGNRVSRKRKREPECARLCLTDKISRSQIISTPSVAVSESLAGPSHRSFITPRSVTPTSSVAVSESLAGPSHRSQIPSRSVAHQSVTPHLGRSVTPQTLIPYSIPPQLVTPHSATPSSVSAPPCMQWSTNVGNIHVQSPSQYTWNSPYRFPFSTTQEEFRLVFRSGNISVCNGCRKKLDKQAKPPNNLCVQHEEWRQYTSPVSQPPESRYGNA